MLILFSSIMQTSCRYIGNSRQFQYNIHKPDEIFILPKILSEISGLASAKDGQLYCVQDEDGLIFLYDLNKKKIVQKIKFSKDNDYEGIAIADSIIYVLKSNGTIYFVKEGKKVNEYDTEKIPTFLDSDCNAEGLCFDNRGNMLLIACKSHGKKSKKAIYKFDLDTKKATKKPIYLIDVEDIRSLKRIGKTQRSYEEFLSFLGKDNITFNPSAIAIHPLTNETFILSARGNTLLVLSEKGDINYAVHLNGSDFSQPEGITFDPEGTLFISNEGSGGKANIKVFKYRK